MDGAVWQGAQGRNWAQMYTRTDRAFTGLTEQLLALIRTLPGETILDIGCGAGELALAVSRQRPRSKVVGLDISADLVDAAGQRSESGRAVEFLVGDAARWSRAGFAPDLLISRHGVMFFEAPEAAFAHLASIATPGAALAFSCFRALPENPWAADVNAILGVPASVEPQAPGPFAFADPGRVETILSVGGWSAVEIRPADFAFILGFGDDPVGDALEFLLHIGPAATALAGLEAAERGQCEAALVRWLEEHRSGEVVALPAAAWLVTARRGR